MSMDPTEKIARQRLSVLELAEALGNVSEACRRRGVSRTQFYEYKRRFQTHGLGGLKDLPPIHHSHPQTTAPEVAERILALSLEHPAWGCDRLSEWLKLEGVSVSGATIQKILNRNGMGSRYDRWLKLEQEHSQQAIELTAGQVAFIEKHNPSFRERHVESSRPVDTINDFLQTQATEAGSATGEPAGARRGAGVTDEQRESGADLEAREPLATIPAPLAEPNSVRHDS